MTMWFTRQQWAARPPKSSRLMAGFESGWFIHWLGVAASPHLSDEQVLRDTQRYHMDTKAWADIAYSFAVGRQRPDAAYELRGWGIQGGHTEGHNSRSMAIVFLNGEGEHPIEDQLVTARSIIAEGVKRGYSSALVRPHNAVRSTACPGPDLTAWVNAGRFTQEIPAMPPTETTKALVEQWQAMLLSNGATLGGGADGLFGRLTLEASKTILDHRNQLLAANATSAETIVRLRRELAAMEALAVQRQEQIDKLTQQGGSLAAASELRGALGNLDVVSQHIAAALARLGAR